MGPVFYQKSLNMGPIFWLRPKIQVFCMAKTPKIANFVKNGPIFQEKSLTMARGGSLSTWLAMHPRAQKA